MKKTSHYPFIAALSLSMCFVLINACGSGQGGNCGEGNDGVPSIIDEDADLDTFRVARLGVGELNQLRGPDEGHSSLVQAFFNDFSEYQVQLADRLYFSDACWVYTSRQVTTGEPLPLAVDGVAVGGLVNGDLNLVPEGDPPTISPEILEGRAFTDQDVTFDVTSGEGDGEFPSFTAQLPAPDPVVLTRLGDRPDPDLGAGPSVNISVDRVDPLLVKWQPGNGDYFEFKLVPGSGSDTKHAKLRCITYDDGCLSVPAEAIVYLVVDKATNFQLKAERHNFELVSIKEEGQTKAAALIDVSSTLEGTVLR